MVIQGFGAFHFAGLWFRFLYDTVLDVFVFMIWLGGFDRQKKACQKKWAVLQYLSSWAINSVVRVLP